jgi:putative ABC transport system substrate-binding protein
LSSPPLPGIGPALATARAIRAIGTVRPSVGLKNATVPANAQHWLVVKRTRQAAAAHNVEFLSLPVTTAADVSLAIMKAEREHAMALLVAADPLNIRNRRMIIDQTLVLNLATMHDYSVEVKDGALISYGSDVAEDYGRTAGYVDRILKGATGFSPIEALV